VNNVVKFPRNKKEEPEHQPPPEQPQRVEPKPTNETRRNILHGIIGVIYIVAASLWVPIRFMLITNVVIQFFRMMINWHNGAFAAFWPFALSFLVASAFTFFMTTWKPKTP